LLIEFSALGTWYNYFMIVSKNEVIIMSERTITIKQIINYPLSGDCSAYKINQGVNLFFSEVEEVYNVPNEKVEQIFSTNIKLAGKIKFILGLIYFFSLVYFSIKLFT
jgi:hypothetical protein